MAFVSFPKGFEWGAATASYQIEGAPRDDGKGLSIWDVFCQQPGRVQGGDTGDVACDHYHRYREDVALMKRLGLQTYRFSVSWPRVQPFGSGRGQREGPRLLLAAGRRAARGRASSRALTLYHWDLPQALQDRGGWADRDTAQRFADYAELVFARLGDRVTRWITHNEPIVTSMMGYRAGVLAPGIRDVRLAVARDPPPAALARARGRGVPRVGRARRDRHHQREHELRARRREPESAARLRARARLRHAHLARSGVRPRLPRVGACATTSRATRRSRSRPTT